jgi:hypothetical protein
MMFHDPDTLQLWINVFLTIAGLSVAFAFAALTVGVRDLRRPAMAAPVPGPKLVEPRTEPARHAA